MYAIDLIMLPLCVHFFQKKISFDVVLVVVMTPPLPSSTSTPSPITTSTLEVKGTPPPSFYPSLDSFGPNVQKEVESIVVCASHSTPISTSPNRGAFSLSGWGCLLILSSKQVWKQRATYTLLPMVVERAFCNPRT